MANDNQKKRARYWETVPLGDMTKAEWEDLCDGCGKCCLLKLEDEESGEVAYTRLHCRLLDADVCRCSDYENRQEKVPDCVSLSVENISALKWMPDTCAYRLVAEGKPLPKHHHLVCGDRTAIHKAGHSILGKTLSEDTVLEEDQIDWIIDWSDAPWEKDGF